MRSVGLISAINSKMNEKFIIIYSVFGVRVKITKLQPSIHITHKQFIFSLALANVYEKIFWLIAKKDSIV